jgi:hypothetical protein
METKKRFLLQLKRRMTASEIAWALLQSAREYDKPVSAYIKGRLITAEPQTRPSHKYHAALRKQCTEALRTQNPALPPNEEAEQLHLAATALHVRDQLKKEIAQSDGMAIAGQLELAKMYTGVLCIIFQTEQAIGPVELADTD